MNTKHAMTCTVGPGSEENCFWARIYGQSDTVIKKIWRFQELAAHGLSIAEISKHLRVVIRHDC